MNEEFLEHLIQTFPNCNFLSNRAVDSNVQEWVAYTTKLKTFLYICDCDGPTGCVIVYNCPGTKAFELVEYAKTTEVLFS